MINFLIVIIITIRNFCGDNKIIKYLIKGGNIVFIKLRHNYIFILFILNMFLLFFIIIYKIIHFI